MTAEEFLQDWAYDTLTAAGITCVGHTGAVPVRDWVPDATDYPYISIGEDTIAEGPSWSDDQRDCTLTLHVWSRYAGKKQAKQIGGALVTSLRASLTSTGEWRVQRVNLDLANYYLDPDARTQHGVIRVRVGLGHNPS